ncbi:hypothetical protein, partial [Escherichia coli]|uniref:hypothetical protein n=1 Tax=Escherichia coli TaxID=562 RepID=UPI0032F016EA
NDVTLKMPAFEWVHVQLHQQKGMISLSPPTICNSAGTVSFTTNPISSGSKISDLERRSRSRLASVVFPAPKGPLIQIIIVDGL